MHQQIIDGTDDPPEKGVQGTDETVKIETVIRIIPKPHVEPDDEDIACDQLDDRHGSNHDQQNQDLRPPAVRIHIRKCNKGHHI